MENRNSLIEEVKRKCNITWNDVDINKDIENMVDDAEITLNYKLGSEIDYSKKGMEHTLFKNYCLYYWNDCLDEFDTKYRNEIYQIRAKYEVKSHAEKKV